jgi:hypothetical protein
VRLHRRWLDERGDEIEKSGRYEPLRPHIWSMDRAAQADEIRRLSSAPDVMLGSTRSPRPDRCWRPRRVAASSGRTPPVPDASFSSWGRRRSCPTFDHLDGGPDGYECVELVSSPSVAHVRFSRAPK